MRDVLMIGGPANGCRIQFRRAGMMIEIPVETPDGWQAAYYKIYRMRTGEGGMVEIAIPAGADLPPMRCDDVLMVIEH